LYYSVIDKLVCISQAFRWLVSFMVLLGANRSVVVSATCVGRPVMTVYTSLLE
jgi:hypothetical protein